MRNLVLFSVDAAETLRDLLVPGICNGLGAAFAGMYPGGTISAWMVQDSDSIQDCHQIQSLQP